MFLLVLEPLPVHAAAGIVQQNNGGCDTCASTTLSIPFLASVASGDVIVAGVMAGAGLSGGTVMSVSDILGSSFTEAVMALNSFSGAVYIYYAVLSSSGSNTVSVTFTSTTQFQNMYVYEVSGVLATPAGTASGNSQSGVPSAIISTSTSVTFQAGAFLLGVMATDGTGTTASAGTNFQLSSDKSGTTLGQGAEWSTSGVSSPTNFPMSLDSVTDWAEVGIALNPPSLSECAGLTALQCAHVQGGYRDSPRATLADSTD